MDLLSVNNVVTCITLARYTYKFATYLFTSEVENSNSISEMDITENENLNKSKMPSIHMSTLKKNGRRKKFKR